MTHTSNTPASQLHPSPHSPDSDLDPRTIRARAESMTVRPLRDGRYVVETDGGTYVVDLTERTCTCPDQAIRHERCKHLRRVAMEITAGRVDAPAWGICAACGSRVTDRHESNADRERPLCSDCRLEPDELVRDRETGRLLVVDTVTDDAASDVELAPGASVAAHPTNGQYGSHEPVVEAIYIGDFLDHERRRGHAGTSTSQAARRYAFPYTRLQRVPDGREWLADMRPRLEPDRRTVDRSRQSADQRRAGTVQTTLGAVT